MSQDRESRVTLRWLVDQAALNQVKSSSDIIVKKLGDIGGEVVKTSASMKKFTEISKTIARANDISDLAKEFAKLGKTINDDTNALKQMKVALAHAGASMDEIDRAVRTFRTVGQVTAQAGGGGGVKAEGLRSVGGSLSQLGLGEAGGALSRIGDVIQVLNGVGSSLGSIGLVAAPLVGILAGVAIGMQLFNAAIADAQKALKTALDSQMDYYSFIQTATRKDVEERIKLHEREAKAAEEARQETERSIQSAKQQLGLQTDDRRILDKFPVLNDLFAQLDKNKDAAEKANLMIGRLNGGLLSNATATNDAIEAENQLTEERKRAVEEGIAREVEARKLLRSGTSQQVKDMIAANEDEIAAIYKQREVVKSQGLVILENANQYGELTKRLEILIGKNKEYATSILPVIEATEKAKAFFKKLFSGDIIPPQAKSAWDDLRERIKQATQEAVARDNALIGSQRKYEADVKQIETSALEKRTDIQKRYNDTIVNIAQKAAEDAANALRKLEEQRADLTRDLGRNNQQAERQAAMQELDIRIGAAREDEREFRNHLRNLERIRQEAQDREFEMILNRDFAGLFFSRRQTTRDLNNETGQFAVDRGERQLGQQQQIDDLRRSIQAERNERLIAYQNALQDAQIAYVRDRQEANRQRIAALNEARADRMRSLSELNQSIRAQLAARRQGYIEELRLATMVAKERIKVENALLDRAKSILSLITKSAPVKRAGGGPLSAFQPALVNEPGSSGRESFSSGGKNTAFPGQGVFIPSQPGQVNANSGGTGGNVTIAPVFNITGGPNPQATAKAIEPIVYKVVKQIVGVN